MQPSRALWEAQADLLANDAGSLGAIAAMVVQLSKAAFAPSLDLVRADLVAATFPGYAAKNAGAAPQDVYYDALTGLYTIRIKEPAGGWNWISTGVPAPAETIYGVFLSDNADAVLWGSMLLPEPVTIDDTGQGVGVGDLLFQWRIDSPF